MLFAATYRIGCDMSQRILGAAALTGAGPVASRNSYMKVNQGLDWLESPAKRHGKALALKMCEVNNRFYNSGWPVRYDGQNQADQKEVLF
jgi:hypothetical protein